MKIDWEASDPPLPAIAVAARARAAEVLAIKADRNPAWTVVRFDEWTVVTGDELPWADGATYLAHLPGTAHVLVPVHRRPRLHPELVERAVAPFRGSARAAALIPGADGVTVLPLPGP